MGRTTSLALVLFAIGLPFATWMHGRAIDEGMRLAQRDAHVRDYHARASALRHAAVQRFFDAATDDDIACEVQQSAQRWFAHERHRDAKRRAWAKQELANTRCDATSRSR